MPAPPHTSPVPAPAAPSGPVRVQNIQSSVIIPTGQSRFKNFSWILATQNIAGCDVLYTLGVMTKHVGISTTPAAEDKSVLCLVLFSYTADLVTHIVS